MTRPEVNCSEASWQSFVTDVLDLAGYRWHHETDSRKSPSGFPDLVAAHPERGILFLELKTERGRLRPEQSAWLSTLEIAATGAGGWVGVYVLRPSQWRLVLDITGVSEMAVAS